MLPLGTACLVGRPDIGVDSHVIQATSIGIAGMVKSECDGLIQNDFTLRRLVKQVTKPLPERAG